MSKYRDLPDQYYDGQSDNFITPEVFESDAPLSQLGKLGKHLSLAETHAPRCSVWEWCSGSSVLSRVCKDDNITHLPPIDYRYGWDLSNEKHQYLLLNTLLSVEVNSVFISPTCAPWGSNSKSLQAAEYREARRAEQRPCLSFLAVVCLIQIILGRKYFIENPAFSDIFIDSPLAGLRNDELPFFISQLDQCACGGTLEGQAVRKRTHFQSSHSMHHLDVKCPGGHKHLHLVGGTRAASSAM